MNPALNPLHFDRGLVEVVDTEGQTPLTLPPHRQLAPAEALARPQLDALLGPVGLDGLIEQALRPPLQDRGLLLPGAFRDALESAHQALRRAAEANPADPAHGTALARASQVLAEDLALRELAQMYRHALHQG